MKKFYIYSFGCKVNRYETELISQKFKSGDYAIADTPQEADTIIFNSCSVTNNADKECLYLLRKSLKLPQKPQIILTGCLAINKSQALKALFPNIEIVSDKKSLYLQPDNQSIISFENRSRAFIKIQDGCNSFCSYCIIPYIRNQMWSKQPKAVFNEIENLVQNGYSEIVLTGIHIGKYDGGLAPLIEKIVKIPLDFRIRISSIEINEINDSLLSLMRDYENKICSHLHIPLQSGSDGILKLMNRQYTSAAFETKIQKIASMFKNIAITTDIISGFPSETPAQHQGTCNFIKRNPFSRLHIFRYSDRSGAKASNLKNKVPPQEIKSRSKELLEIDAAKRKDFLTANAGSTRKAVSIAQTQSLTDNYITLQTQSPPKGIFDIKI
ncbi:MAG: MiaB/RimO family radical SAM methylthiotransferase [Endomicrobium sp.]|jgi:threonylcarbamoyladenosine tRNA methylthiotransferase MtaB|nr:MiaB/RimO family radical SAM methylthiotransferase [Endomicrobium sp.]